MSTPSQSGTSVGEKTNRDQRLCIGAKHGLKDGNLAHHGASSVPLRPGACAAAAACIAAGAAAGAVPCDAARLRLGKAANRARRGGDGCIVVLFWLGPGCSAWMGRERQSMANVRGCSQDSAQAVLNTLAH